MKNIKISEEIINKVPHLKLGIVSSSVQYEKLNEELQKIVQKEIERIQKIPIESVKEILQIASSREAYKALGKEPARYRLSAEALHRRIINGKGIYQISNIVDVINLSSVKTAYSIGGYDLDKINGDIIFDIGNAEENYEAIGRGKMNIESLPVFRDNICAFGSPTSDSVRTMITENTENVLLIVINFGNHDEFSVDLNHISELLNKYCSGKNIITEII